MLGRGLRLASLESLDQRLSKPCCKVELSHLKGRFCREAEASREKETRSGLLMIATKAALAEQELLTARLQSESQRLGNLTIGMAGHLGQNLALSLET